MSIGMGAMLYHLGGGSEHSSEEYKGKKIVKILQQQDELNIDFEDGKKISIWDSGQSCCEHRYMTTDDNLQDLEGKTLVHIMAKEGPTVDSDWGDPHEQVFVEIMTNDGCVTVCNHNEHNGYYGGFGLTITEREEESLKLAA